MTKFNLFIFLASLFILVSCSKETEEVIVQNNEEPTTETAPDSVETFIESLYGTWNWVETRGGFYAGTLDNPELSGNTKAYVFSAPNDVKRYKNEELIRIGTFEVGIDSVKAHIAADPEFFYTIKPTYTIDPETGEEYEVPLHSFSFILYDNKTPLEDTLILHDHNVTDGQWHTYVRD